MISLLPRLFGRRVRWFGRLIALVSLLAWGASSADAHVWNMTRVRVAFLDRQHSTVQLDVDLTRQLGSAGEYYALTQAPAGVQRERLERVFAEMWPRLRFRSGELPLAGQLRDFRLPTGERREFGYVGIGKITTLVVDVNLPDPAGGELWFSPDPEVAIEYPVAVTFEVPTRGLAMTRWLDAPGPSRRFDYAAKVTAPTVVPVADAGARLDMSEDEAATMSVLLTMWRYLHLGFRHIFPTGADHVLFVVGLFFLGIDWRKLLTQTTVFTIAHTTTLGLSACGIFSLPAWFVEPAIAGSIAFVAIENIVRPKLTSARLVIVFAFGLIHGLGFAGSLAEIGLPRKEFWVALLSFNFGVDFGQLFVLALCFLLVGWFRQRTWFRPRVAIPVCTLVAVIGLIWAGQRIVHYALPA